MWKSALFGAKTSDILKFMVYRTKNGGKEGVEPVRTFCEQRGGQFYRFCADVFYGRPQTALQVQYFPCLFLTNRVFLKFIIKDVNLWRMNGNALVKPSVRVKGLHVPTKAKTFSKHLSSPNRNCKNDNNPAREKALRQSTFTDYW